MQEFFDTNRELWDAKTGVHLQSAFYDLEGFKAGKNSLNQIELDDIGSQIKGSEILHLQCHFGQDSLSMARMGARVTGVDLSPKAIKAANELRDELQLDAEFIVSNLYDLPKHLDRKFDLVFTSYGTITWLPDLQKWANIIAHFLRPGGLFYIADFHPTFYMFDFPSQQIQYHYFNPGQPYIEDTQGTYADRDANIQHREYFWTHSLSEVITPLLQAGLELETFKEFPYSPYNCFENMVERPEGGFVFRGPSVLIPHVFSLKMRQPSSV